MKQFYLLLIILFNLNSLFAQDGNLEGTWYLTSVEVDDVIYPNYYNDVSLFEIEFMSFSNEDFLSFNGSGSCESFGGICDFNNNEITINEINFTLGGGCSSLIPADQFQDLYFYGVIETGQTIPYNLAYEITGPANNQNLTITNTANGNVANYSSVPSTQRLAGTWYLSRIEIPGNEAITIPETSEPTLNLTYTIDPIFNELMVDGNGDCNSFFANYMVSLSNGNNLQVSNFTQTLADCSPSFEDQYFPILSNFNTNFSDFEIINDGETLILTDLLGARLIFNDDALSVNYIGFNSSKIVLIKNPVSNSLDLTTSQNLLGSNYEIFSITGKRITKGILNSNSINMNQLHSGLYFLKVSKDEHMFETVKFIKD